MILKTKLTKLIKNNSIIMQGARFLPLQNHSRWWEQNEEILNFPGSACWPLLDTWSDPSSESAFLGSCLGLQGSQGYTADL